MDAQSVEYLEFAEEGTFSTCGGRLQLTAERSYVRAGGEPTPGPTRP